MSNSGHKNPNQQVFQENVKNNADVSGQQQTDTSEVYFWGSNQHGQLGVDNNDYSDCLLYPKLMRYPTTILKISCGFEHSFFLTNEKQIYCMGNNGYGQLGFTFNVTKRNSPTLVRGSLGTESFDDIECGGYHTIAVVNNCTKLIAWGRNDHSQCGTGNIDEKVKPNVIKLLQIHRKNFPEDKNVKIAKISGGQIHSGAVLDNGDAYCWGANDFGQCGSRPMEDFDEGTPIINFTPQRAEFDQEAVSIACGYTQTLFLTSAGEVYASGNNENGQLGVNIEEDFIFEPQFVEFEKDQQEFVRSIECSNFSSLITNHNNLYIWGCTPNGLQNYPEKIIGLENKVEQAKLGENFVTVLDVENYVYSWGSNESGQLGMGNNFEQQKDACIIDMLNEREIKELYNGRDFVMVQGAGHLDKLGFPSPGEENQIENYEEEYEDEQESDQIMPTDYDTENIINHAHDMINTRKHNDMIHIQNVNQVVDGDVLKAYSNSNKSNSFYKSDKEAAEVREFDNIEAHEIGEGEEIREFDNLETQNQYDEEGEEYPENESEPMIYNQNEINEENPIYQKNSIADIYKSRQQNVDQNMEETEINEQDQMEEEQSNVSDNKDEIIATMREEINTYKNLICCYELNRQGLLKIIAGLTDNHPDLVNEINPESTENMILQENLIEHYLSIVKFRVTDELEAFDFPDVENLNSNGQRTALNLDSTTPSNKLIQIPGKNNNLETDSTEQPLYLQHHQISHVRDLSHSNNILNQNSYSQNHRNIQNSISSKKQTENTTPNTRKFSNNLDQENDISHNYSSSQVSHKYLNLDIEQLKRDLLNNKKKIQERIVEIEDQITVNNHTKSQHSNMNSYPQSNYISFTKQSIRNTENTKSIKLTSKDLLYKERDFIREHEKPDLLRERKFLRD